MKVPLFVLPAVVAAALSFALTPPVRALAFRLGAVDQPGPRKVHTVPIPRMGGLAAIVAVVVVLLLERALGLAWWVRADTSIYLGLLCGLVPILAVSLMDDVRSLGPWPRLGAQCLGAAMAVGFGISLGSSVHLFGTELPVGWLALPLSVLWLVGVTNAFNIIDGLDGLAAGLGLISTSTLVVVFAFVGQWDMAHLALVCAGALIGFLPFNLHPARVFLGDTGATALGFALGCLTLRGGATLSAGMATLLPLVLLGLPMIETGLSVARRAIGRLTAGGVHVMGADRNHIHHRLLASGVSHRAAVWLLYAVGIVLSAVALASLFMTARRAAVLLLATIIAGSVGIGRLGYEEFGIARKGVVLRFARVPVLKRALFVAFVDLAILMASAYLALALKFDVWDVTGPTRAQFLEMITILVPVSVVTFDLAGMYRGAWYFKTVDDFLRAATAILQSTTAALIIDQLIATTPLPGSVYGIYALAMVTLVSGSRLASRVARHAHVESTRRGEAVLIYGAGRSGAAAAREMLENEAAGMKPVGFVDDDPLKAGRSIEGVKVLGGVSRLGALLDRTAARRLVVASGSVTASHLAEAVRVCDARDVSVLRAGVRFVPLASGGWAAPAGADETPAAPVVTGAGTA